MVSTKLIVLPYSHHLSFYQACAPFWQNIGPDKENKKESPVGLCAFSGRDLRDFQYTKPCRSEQT